MQPTRSCAGVHSREGRSRHGHTQRGSPQRFHMLCESWGIIGHRCRFPSLEGRELGQCKVKGLLTPGQHNQHFSVPLAEACHLVFTPPRLGPGSVNGPKNCPPPVP